MNDQTTRPAREGFVTEPPKLEPSAPVERTADVIPLQQRGDIWPLRVRLLHKPIRDEKNQEVRELAFREPTGGDINRYGNPVVIDLNGNGIIDEIKMTRMMAALSGLLPPFLEMMDPRDWNSCAYRLRVFFLPDPAAW
jgi:hypothetical protein